MSSSSPATGSDSRSSSPHTPSPQPSPFDSVAVQDDFGSWYQSDAENLLSPQTSWPDPALQMNPQKCEDNEQILHLDDLIQRSAYDESPAPIFNSLEPSSPPEIPNGQATFVPPNLSSFHSSNLFISNRTERVISTRPIPPPASIPRKLDPSTNYKVVCPPKESCHNLSIMFPSLPEGGAKSRVETQIRVTVDLADASSSSDPTTYDRVGSWKWLKLPRGTATKRRTRKQGKIDPDPAEILYLTATVTCASAPHSRVYSCTSCQSREAKRLAKKLAARVRPTRSDSDSSGDPTNKVKRKQYEDTTSIIQFNCAEVQEFSAGSVILPLRITCYCRHHREKVGFQVHFDMMDHTGRIVGTGTSNSIMITDDHKTPGLKNADASTGASNFDVEWSRDKTKVEPSAETRAPSKRKKDAPAPTTGKKRVKPYDVASKPDRWSREVSTVDSLHSPSSSYADTRSPTPNLLVQPVPQLQQSSLESDSSGDVPATPPDYNMLVETQQEPTSCQPFFSPASTTTIPHTLPFTLFDAVQPSQSFAIPTIHRLIPNTGPTHGGTEVTILGANFHPSLQLDCVFGDVMAGSTQRWSDNTLVCILPPRATPGVVSVWFNNLRPLNESSNSSALFTYSDESDRALMELALQVVGLKMTGKIEDAKNVAMRIVGNVTEGSSMQTDGTISSAAAMQGVSTSRSLRPLLFGQATETESFEARIIKFLSILHTSTDLSSARSISLSQAISHPAPSGQTLLHLASFLGFYSLVEFLVIRGADLDARDRSGCTALHFAAMAGSGTCLDALLRAGADPKIVNAVGKTPREVAVREGLFGLRPDPLDSPSAEISGAGEDEEVHWGDAEEDSDDNLQRNPLRRLAGRRRRSTPSGKHTPRRVISPRSSSSSLAGPTDTPGKATDDDKQAATLFAMIQRTLAQLPAPQFRNLPGLGQLPEMPAVPWVALPQLPIVFPVLVPWPAFLGGDAPGGGPREGEDPNKGIGGVSSRAAQELRGTWEAWEKWLALTIARTARQQEETPPPMYTPRETPEQPAPSAQTAESIGTSRERPVSTGTPPEVASISRVSYNALPSVSEQEVNAYAYVPAETPKKHDRMLMFFWLPILMISLLWAMHSGLRMLLQTVKTAIPLKTGLRT